MFDATTTTASNHSTASAAETTGRDDRGRFSKGNPGGPGNPFARRVASMRQALMDAVTPEDVSAIGKKMVEQALEGDVAAARLVFTYVIGKPQATEDPDRLDEKEWQQYVNETVREGEVEAVVGGMSAALACDIANAAVPGLQAQASEQIQVGLLAVEEVDDEPEEADRPESKPAAAGRDAKPAARDAGPDRVENAAAKLMAKLLETVNNQAETEKRAANSARPQDNSRRGSSPGEEATKRD